MIDEPDDVTHRRPSAASGVVRRARGLGTHLFVVSLVSAGLAGCTAILGFDKSVESADELFPGSDASGTPGRGSDAAASPDGGPVTDTTDGGPDTSIELPTEPYLDPTFGHRGRVVVGELPNSVSIGLRDYYTGSVAVANDGAIGLLCSFDSGVASAVRVFRLQSDGSMDKSFGGADGSGGVISAGLAYAIAFQGSKIVAVGNKGSTNANALSRLGSDGQPDGTLAAGGAITKNVSASSSSFKGLSAQANGDLLLWGWKAPLGGNSASFVTSYVATTSSFSSMLMTTDGLPDIFDARGAVAVSNGRVILFGDMAPASSGPRSLAVTRFNGDGALDTTFGTNGIVRYTPNPSLQVLAGAGDVDGLGRTVVAASVSASTQSFIARFSSAGALDTTFGTSGILSLVVPASVVVGAQFPLVNALIHLPDGRIVIAGNILMKTGKYRLFVARLGADGALDTTFGTGGYALPTIFDNNPVEDVKALTLQADGRVVAMGTATNPGGTRNLVALRFQP